MLLMLDGFDSYATADIAKKWTTIVNAPVINATGGRRGGGALELNQTDEVVKTIAASASLIIGFAFYNTVIPTSTRVLAQFKDVATAQCSLLINADGTLSVVRGTGTAVTNGTSVSVLSINTWYYIEWKVTFADSIAAGSCKVRLNGVDIITVATSQDLKATANATANQVCLYTGNTGADSNIRTYDDLYIADLTGSAPQNDFLGDCRIDTLLPNADGSNSAFTCSTGSSHYVLVDDATPNTTDYNESATPGAKDTYAFQNLAAITGTIFGLQVSAALLKDDAGSRTVANTIKSGATNANGATVAPSTSQLYFSDIWSVDPNTTSAWSEAGIAALEAGLVIIA